MGWLRASDTAAHDPRTLAPLDREDADERTVDEVFGFSVRLACEAGGKETDGHVTRAMARALAGTPARADRLMQMLVEAKVWEPTKDGWQLLKDTKYLHLRDQGEVERDRVRGRDEKDDALTVPARLRDGDHCRYCRKRVNWNDRRSLRGGTWEHVNIANQPTQLEEFVVCCFECNRAPSNRGELVPPPTKPVYGEETKTFVRRRLGHWPSRTEIAERLSQRTQPENAVERQRTGEGNAATGQRPSKENAANDQRTGRENAAQDADQRPESTSESAAGTSTQEAREEPPGGDLAPGGMREPGHPGRDGKGLAESGSAQQGTHEPAPGTKPRKRSQRTRAKAKGGASA